MMQRPGPFHDVPPTFENRSINSVLNEQRPSPTLGRLNSRDEAEERARRTSISGILHRPESEPQHPIYSVTAPHNAVASFARPASTNGDEYGSAKAHHAPERPATLSGSYDTRPPPFPSSIRPTPPPVTSNRKENQRPQEKPEIQSLSPEIRRLQMAGQEPRGLASILNSTGETGTGPQSMLRQDSMQSQSDRSAFGDRYRARAFSPFAGSAASQTMSVTSFPPDDPTRKGSDELSQHRTILGLNAESKRGRFSPVPQAVQGAQAHTPVPDAGIKSEHGRVFSGLGGGLGTSTGASSGRPGLAGSPFRSNEGSSRLSEENLMKISRSSSGITKRARKYDDEVRAESEAGVGKKIGRASKRGKYSHSYRLEVDDASKKNSALSGMNPNRSAATPTSTPTQHAQQLHHHHHHLQRPSSSLDQPTLFKPRKTIRISSIITAAKRLPRRHIGSFKYEPIIEEGDLAKPGIDRIDISVRPNLLPSFVEANKVNCTYSVRVPKLWLQERERRLVCKSAYLWGSGIYSDDSDVVAAAMHSGFIKSAAPEGVDRTLLDRVTSEQNAKIEGLINVPDKPAEPESGKDAIVTLLVLPNLEFYGGSARFGICSRTWPETAAKTQHDGVSFAVLKVEFLSGGVEARRMGRTGVSKRARIKQELEARKRSETLRLQMVEKMRKKKQEMKTRTLANTSALTTNVSNAKASKPVSSSADKQRSIIDLSAKKDTPTLNVGQTPGDWLCQMEVSALE
jgi:Histone deacetylation protein Rxt3